MVLPECLAWWCLQRALPFMSFISAFGGPLLVVLDFVEGENRAYFVEGENRAYFYPESARKLFHERALAP